MFGVPYEIVCDNGSQFISDETEAFCYKWNFTLTKSTPRYPHVNGKAKSSNKIIINNLKKRLTSYNNVGLNIYHGYFGPTRGHLVHDLDTIDD